MQSFKALRKEAPAPFADGELTQPKALRDGGVRLAFGAGQNDLRAADDAVGERAGVGESQQLGFVVFAEGEGGEGSAARHERTPVNEEARYYITYLWDNTPASSPDKGKKPIAVILLLVFHCRFIRDASALSVSSNVLFNSSRTSSTNWFEVWMSTIW